LSDKSDNAIRSAVKDCLARCYKGDTPLGVMAEFLAELRQQGWSESDIRLVELAVRKVLAGVMSEDRDQDSQSEK
jgi:hypothetical protein